MAGEQHSDGMLSDTGGGGRHTHSTASVSPRTWLNHTDSTRLRSALDTRGHTISHKAAYSSDGSASGWSNAASVFCLRA